MRRFIRFCLFLAIVPAVILVYSLRRPLRLYGEQWLSLQRHFVLKENTIKLRKPFLSNSTAKTDPEAADMAELIYQHYSSPPNFDVYEDVEAIAALSQKYPNKSPEQQRNLNRFRADRFSRIPWDCSKPTINLSLSLPCGFTAESIKH
jgi:hypothetical protein